MLHIYSKCTHDRLGNPAEMVLSLLMFCISISAIIHGLGTCSDSVEPILAAMGNCNTVKTQLVLKSIYSVTVSHGRIWDKSIYLPNNPINFLSSCPRRSLRRKWFSLALVCRAESLTTRSRTFHPTAQRKLSRYGLICFYTK